MKKKNAGYRQTFALDASGIDAFSEALENQLLLRGVEHENRIRIRLSLEESLLRMRDRFGEKESFHLIIDSRIGGFYVQVEKEGPVYNPLSKTEVELEDWSGSLLTSVGMSPLYSYSAGKNYLRLNLAGQTLNPVLTLMIASAGSLAAGILMRFLLPADILALMVEKVFGPLYDLWIRILTLLYGPLIFIMVLTSVLNVDRVSEEGGDSRQSVIRYFLMSMLSALIAVTAAAVIFRIPVAVGKTLGINAQDYLEAILNIVPDNVFNPLIHGNTPQILLLAFILGKAVSLAGSRADRWAGLIRQGNTVGLFLMAGVSRCVPFFAGALLCMEVINNSIDLLRGTGIVLVLSVLVSSIFLCLVVFYVSRRWKVPFRILVEKVRPAFITAIRAGRLDTGYGQMKKSCSRDLGIEKHFTEISLLHGLVLYMPVNVIGTLLFTIFAAVKFDVSISLGWLVIAMVMAVVLFVATPPVPGANLLAYIMIFSLLGIPSEALIIAMIFDIVFGIFASAANQTLLQMDLILQASRIGLLDKDILRQPPVSEAE